MQAHNIESQAQQSTEEIPTIEGVQVSIANSHPLRKEYACTVTHTACKAPYLVQVEKLKKAKKVDGFRPGKVPSAKIEELYFKELSSTVFDQLIRNISSKIIQQNEYDLISQPTVEALDPANATLENWHSGNFGFGFRVSFDLFPVVPDVDLSTITLDSIDLELTPEELQKELSLVAEKNATLESVPEGTPAKEGDVLDINFVGSVDGQEFEGGTANNYSIRIGSGVFIANFEDQLVGLKVGETKDVSVTFPEEYHEPSLAGKLATFKVTVNDVKAISGDSAEPSDEMAKKLSFDSLEELKQDITARANAFYKNAYKDSIKKHVMESVCQNLEFELPPAAIMELESRTMAQEKVRMFRQQSPEGAPTREEVEAIEIPPEKLEDIKKECTRTLKLSYFLTAFAKKNNIELTQEDFKNFILETASNMNLDPNEVFNFYNKNDEHTQRMRTTIMEFKIYDNLYSKLNVIHHKLSKAQADKVIKKVTEQK